MINSFVKVIYSSRNSHVNVLVTYVGRSEANRKSDEDQNEQLDIAEIR